MNTFSFPRLALGATALFALAGCGDEEHVDVGPVRTETRELDDFDSIDMEGAARLRITIGTPAAVVLEGHEKELERVKTDVRGDTLHIRTKPKDWIFSGGRQRLTVRITLPELEDLRLEGGNEVRLTGFNGGESKISSAGATSIKAEGRLDELTVRLAGAGHADFSRLIADEAKVTVDGVGSVIVHPKETLNATMNGVGAILYTGSPREVNTRMNGLGTIGRRDSHSGEDAADDVEVEPEAEPEIDPRDLQPEYEEPVRKSKRDKTEVI